MTITTTTTMEKIEDENEDGKVLGIEQEGMIRIFGGL
jgi:hypothetical protein